MNDKIDLFSFFDERKIWEEVYCQRDCDGCECELDSFEFPTSFVSIDFENLYPQRVSACSVGMVKYIDGIKQEKTFYSLIRPPFEYEGKRGPALTWIHGFTENSFEGQPTFDEVLPQMEEFIDGMPLVAHNACVERACIHDCCAYYNIETTIPYENIMDTYLLSMSIEEKLGLPVCGKGSHTLNVVCQRFGVKELNHHHACDDAEMCGDLFLIFPKYLSGELKIDATAWEKSLVICEKEPSFGNYIYDSYASRGHTDICGDVLQKDLSSADPCNPFYDRKVVITGVFNIERQKLANILKSMGADIDKGVGSKTNYLLIGEEPGPSKIKKFDDLIAAGKDVRKIYQEDLDLILGGKEYDKYYINMPVCEPKEATPKERKTTWPNLVKKFKQYTEGENIVFTERELQSEDFRLLSLYYKQQQKISTTKETILANVRQLEDAYEDAFKKDILACFVEGETVLQEDAYERMQNVFTKYGLQFKAKNCVLTELGVDYEVFKVKGIHHLTIKQLPQS